MTVLRSKSADLAACGVQACWVLCLLLLPELGWGQDIFLRGATSLQSTVYLWLSPIAIILVMGLGIFAATGRISWGWPMLAILGIAISFGAPQIVTWVRGMFGT